MRLFRNQEGYLKIQGGRLDEIMGWRPKHFISTFIL